MKNKLVIALGLLLGIACSSLQAQDDARITSYLKQIEALKKKDSKRISGLERIGNEKLSEEEKSGLMQNWITDGNKILVTAIAKGDVNILKTELDTLGITNAKIRGNFITGYITIDKIPELEQCSIITAHPEVAATNIGRADNQAVVASFTKNAKKFFGDLDGSGIKIGILSNSYDDRNGAAKGILSGDLPGKDNPNGYTKEVQVLSEIKGKISTDEGRAMAELIHDIVPGAELLFYSAFNGEFDFADGIIALADAGCDIIVDDISYVTEPFFQNGPVARAAKNVVDRGVTFFSSAGNSSNKSYLAPFKPSGDIVEDGGEYHDFGGGDITKRVKINNPGSETRIGSLAFQWDDFFLYPDSTKEPVTNLDIFIFNAETGLLLAKSDDKNESRPFESVSLLPINTDQLELDIMVKKVSGPAPRMIVIYDRDDLIENVEEFEGNNSGTTFGHANVEEVISVGATFFQNTAAFGKEYLIQPFSSYGGIPILKDDDGNDIAPIILNKPDVVGVDGVNTSFFGIVINGGDGFLNFIGTSASAPNVAAIAAMMLQVNKDLTPQEIKEIMIASAADMDDPLTPEFDTGFDFATGNGFVQADIAIGLLLQSPKPTVLRYQVINAETNRIISSLADGDDLSLNLIEDSLFNIEAVIVDNTGRSSVAMEMEGNTAFTVPNRKLNQFTREYSLRTRREIRKRRGNGKDYSFISSQVNTIDGFTDFKGTLKRTAVENVAPYSLFGDRNGNFNQWSPAIGSYTLKTTPYSEKNASGIEGGTDIINFDISYTPNAFLLVSNANDLTGLNSFIFLDDQGEIDLGLLTDRPNITALLAAPGLVEFPLAAQIDYELSGTQQFSTSDTTAPFSVFGDDEGGTTGFWNAPEVGPYALHYQILAREGDYSVSSAPVFINFNVVDPNATEAKAAIVGNGNVGFTVYPNPTTGILSLEAKNGKLSDVQVFNSLGQRVFNHKNTVESLQQVDLSSYDNGLYVIKAFIGSESFATKIVVQK